MSWLLIVVLQVNNMSVPVQVPGFQTEAECRQLGVTFVDWFAGATYHCAQDSGCD